MRGKTSESSSEKSESSLEAFAKSEKKKAPRKAPEERLSLHEIISVALVSSHGCVVCLPYGVKIVVARTQNPHDALKLFEFKTF